MTAKHSSVPNSSSIPSEIKAVTTTSTLCNQEKSCLYNTTKAAAVLLYSFFSVYKKWKNSSFQIFFPPNLHTEAASLELLKAQKHLAERNKYHAVTQKDGLYFFLLLVNIEKPLSIHSGVCSLSNYLFTQHHMNQTAFNQFLFGPKLFQSHTRKNCI